MVEYLSFYRVNDLDWMAVRRNEVEPAARCNVAFTADTQDAGRDRVAVAKAVKEPSVNAGGFEGFLNLRNVSALDHLHAKKLAR